MRTKIRVLAALIAVASSAAHAEDHPLCEKKEGPRVVRGADFGRIEMGSGARCADNPDDVEGSCEFNRNGVGYGISHGYVVVKEIRQGLYSGKMPFGLKWGDDFAVVERRARALAHGRAVFEPGTTYDGQPFLSSDGGCCLRTRRDRREYAMAFVFDKARKLVRISAGVPFD